jgi:hypothetical protein
VRESLFDTVHHALAGRYKLIVLEAIQCPGQTLIGDDVELQGDHAQNDVREVPDGYLDEAVLFSLGYEVDTCCLRDVESFLYAEHELLVLCHQYAKFGLLEELHLNGDHAVEEMTLLVKRANSKWLELWNSIKVISWIDVLVRKHKLHFIDHVKVW